MHDIVLKRFRQWRAIIMMCIVYLMYFTNTVVSWYFTLPDPTSGQSAFASATVATTVGAIISFAATKGVQE
ncbi:MAG: hypothetical protein Q9M11_07110 [Mariprofundaceae bacterium]|nr:hypothetical protein [Mariprofundaceae bacterium]